MALLKSCCFFLISLRSIINLAHDFKSPFLDKEITIILFHFPKSNLELRNGVCIFIWFDGKCQNGFECDLLKKGLLLNYSLELFRKC